MRLFQFIKWWWDKNDWFSRTVAILLFTSVIPTAIAAFWIGEAAAQILLVGGAIAVACWVIYGLFYWFRGMYREFVNDCPTPDEAIIRKLKGIPTPSKTRDDLHEYY